MAFKCFSLVKIDDLFEILATVFLEFNIVGGVTNICSPCRNSRNAPARNAPAASLSTDIFQYRSIYFTIFVGKFHNVKAWWLNLKGQSHDSFKPASDFDEQGMGPWSSAGGLFFFIFFFIYVITVELEVQRFQQVTLFLMHLRSKSLVFYWRFFSSPGLTTHCGS